MITVIILPERYQPSHAFKSRYMLSHHVTSSRLLVHFAMEQHLLAATPGFLRKFHFFALVNKTWFSNSKDSVPWGNWGLGQVGICACAEMCQKSCGMNQVHYPQNTCCKTNCQRVAVLKTFELCELFCHGRLPGSLLQQNLKGKTAAMPSSLIIQLYSQCENQSCSWCQGLQNSMHVPDLTFRLGPHPSVSLSKLWTKIHHNANAEQTLLSCRSTMQNSIRSQFVGFRHWSNEHMVTTSEIMGGAKCHPSDNKGMMQTIAFLRVLLNVNYTGSIGILQCACFWFNEYWDAWPAIVPTTQFDL